MDNKFSLFVKSIILVLSFAAVVKAGPARIIGGDEAPQLFGLFHASLQNLTGYHVCGGAIVSRWHVVSAAHCLIGAKPEYIQVIVGTTNLNNNGIKHDVAAISIYDSFNFSSRVDDIALLKVTEPFDLNYVRIISLGDEYLNEGDIVFLSGFGAQQVNGLSSTEMQVLTLPIFNQTICQYAMRYTREVTKTMVCTFTKIGQGTCYGDSGSPIVKDEKLVGVVSWGIPCAVGFPDVHTRVAPFVKWIRNEIWNDLCSAKK